jgi:hypothetical protein
MYLDDYIENLVAVHHGHQVLSFRKFDDIVCIARDHDNTLDIVTAHLIIEDFSLRIIFIAKLNQTMTTYNNELLPLGVSSAALW